MRQSSGSPVGCLPWCSFGPWETHPFLLQPAFLPCTWRLADPICCALSSAAAGKRANKQEGTQLGNVRSASASHGHLTIQHVASLEAPHLAWARAGSIPLSTGKCKEVKVVGLPCGSDSLGGGLPPLQHIRVHEKLIKRYQCADTTPGQLTQHLEDGSWAYSVKAPEMIETSNVLLQQIPAR